MCQPEGTNSIELTKLQVGKLQGLIHAMGPAMDKEHDTMKITIFGSTLVIEMNDTMASINCDYQEE